MYENLSDPTATATTRKAAGKSSERRSSLNVTEWKMEMPEHKNHHPPSLARSASIVADADVAMCMTVRCDGDSKDIRGAVGPDFILIIEYRVSHS